MSILSKLGYGVTVALVGILIVFIGLIILILVITVMGKIFDAVNKSKQEKKAAEAPKPAPAPAPAPVPAEPVVEEEAVDDSELIAVIAAAIAAYDNNGNKLVVRKVRRVSGWNKASREDQVYHF